nr:uncharacterized protein LOC125182161 [Anser cygnoides]
MLDASSPAPPAHLHRTKCKPQDEGKWHRSPPAEQRQDLFALPCVSFPALSNAQGSCGWRGDGCREDNVLHPPTPASVGSWLTLWVGRAPLCRRYLARELRKTCLRERNMVCPQLKFLLGAETMRRWLTGLTVKLCYCPALH